MRTIKQFYTILLLCVLYQPIIPIENTTIQEINVSSNQEAKDFIETLDATLCNLVKIFPEKITMDEFEEIVEHSFQTFYRYITTSKPKGQQHAIIMYLQYCELLFKHGSVAKALQTKNEEQREAFAQSFILVWENILNKILLPLETSVYQSIIHSNNKN